MKKLRIKKNNNLLINFNCKDYSNSAVANDNCEINQNLIDNFANYQDIMKVIVNITDWFFHHIIFKTKIHHQKFLKLWLIGQKYLTTNLMSSFLTHPYLVNFKELKWLKYDVIQYIYHHKLVEIADEYLANNFKVLTKFKLETINNKEIKFIYHHFVEILDYEQRKNKLIKLYRSSLKSIVEQQTINPNQRLTNADYEHFSWPIMLTPTPDVNSFYSNDNKTYFQIIRSFAYQVQELMLLSIDFDTFNKLHHELLMIQNHNKKH
ncbi:hypothetical protein [Spiroplasma sp. DGKH1]|uniref:hypothetical protein n=1 Tax=Spiroplasma sp. DGKH1 TaxID=3050074 RepID=UPI0034C6A0A4